MANEDQSTFDVEFALNQFSGNQTLLLKMLERFCEQHASLPENLLTYANTNNHKLAKQEVHSIKGVSGNLGMTNLHQACREFEDLLRQHEIAMADSARLINTMNNTLEQVRHYISSIDEVPVAQDDASAPSNEANASARQTLLIALKRNEFISSSKLSALISDLSMHADTLLQLQTSIDDLDYEKAISLLE